MAIGPGAALTPARTSSSFAFGPGEGPSLAGVGSVESEYVATPGPLPGNVTFAGNLQISLSNQLALQLSKLFQDLFPLSKNFEYEAEVINDDLILGERVNVLVDDILQIKMTILVINQLTQLGNVPPTRIPAGYNPGGPNTDPSNIAGLNTSNNPNPVINIVDNLYLDVTTGAFASAQSDYARLRNRLRPYFAL